MNLFKKSRYESDPSTIKEFVEYTEWYKQHHSPAGESDEEAVKAYLKEKDIALTGLNKLQGANTRNATAELWLGIGGALVAIIIASFLAAITDVSWINKWIIYLANLL